MILLKARTYWALVAVILPLGWGCAATEESEGGRAVMRSGDARLVRPPVVAGQFYPGEAATLARDVERFLEQADMSEVPGRIVGLVAPHAGYVYSGGVAAHAYRLLERNQFDVVVVLAPSHRVPFSGASVFLGDAYQTPLGLVPVDTELSRQLADASPLLSYRPDAHRYEHSLEVQLPFLQKTLGAFTLVAVVMGRSDASQCESIASVLADLLVGREALVVASTDLSHYHPQREAVALDHVVLRHVEEFDPEGLLEDVRRGECEACGAIPLATAMMACRRLGATGAMVLKYATSGDVTGDHSAVVGYMAAALYAREDAAGAVESGGNPGGHEEWPPLPPEAQRELLRMAREAIAGYAESGSIPRFEPALDELRSKRGVFVTLTEHGRLRGCIGHHEPDTPLYRLVPEMAVAAGFRDPRFPPLTLGELARIHIKISAYLTPVYEIASPAEYELGQHGIILEKGARAATFLPEVPTEQGWDRETTFEHLCAKAGLPQGAWREGSRFHVYKTQVFEEEP
jgi:AmmeMemoRadiSam system protein B/AmmeMemoRadiSam system protein A